jgi:hypothetical protein
MLYSKKGYCEIYIQNRKNIVGERKEKKVWRKKKCKEHCHQRYYKKNLSNFKACYILIKKKQ